MLRPLSRLAVLALGLGCATNREFDRSTEPGGTPLGTTTAGTVVLEGDALALDPSRTVLEAIQRAMPQVKVIGWTLNRCPVVELRGKDTLAGNSDPDVYVDGTRTVDTCPLSTLPAMQTQRIEVYPMGVTSRPGYSSRGHGLILIFLRRAG
jgi:hypothetical protein